MGVLTWVRTAVHLHPGQLAAQLRHRVKGPARIPRRNRGHGSVVLASVPVDWGPSPEGQVDAAGDPILLHQSPFDVGRNGWNPVASDLFRYTLHYHGWLPRLTTASGLALLSDWIERHPHGVGWEPYPTSMRLLAWLGFIARLRATHGVIPDHILASMTAQAQHLAANLEHHLGGNHLWTNACALTCMALVLPSVVPLDRSGETLIAIVRSQLAADGLHRERTPSYHGLLAEQLWLVERLARHHAPPLAETLRFLGRPMVSAMASVTHPDGDVALWGDSQLDFCVTPRGLAHRVGVPISEGHATTWASGFARRVWGRWTVLINRGDLGLAHQVGHIHADAASIEASLDGTRLVVDAGVGTYARGAARAYARSTRAHNTATLGRDDPDQHEMWASHRIGGRGRILPGECEDGHIALAVEGWRSPAVHRRTLSPRPSGRLLVRDTVDPPSPFVVRYHVPRSLQPQATTAGYTLTAPEGLLCEIHIRGGSHRWSPVPGWAGISRTAPRWCLSIASCGGPVEVELVPGPVITPRGV